MTITNERAVVQQMSDAQLRDAIAALLDRVEMNRQELGDKGAVFEIDAFERGVLADIEAMEWLLSRG